MSVATLDHSFVAVSRLTSRYQQDEKLKAWLAALTEGCNDIEHAAAAVALLDDLDALSPGVGTSIPAGQPLVSGYNLDIIGARVGQPRRIKNAIPVYYFGFADDTTALGFGEDDDPSVGGFYWEPGLPLVEDALLDDETYRTAIRCRIFKNQCVTPNAEAVYTTLRMIFSLAQQATMGPTPFVVRDTGCMSLEIGISVKPTPLQQALLKLAGILPIPTATRVMFYWFDSAVHYFGFSDDSTAYGFSDDADGGGVLIEEF